MIPTYDLARLLHREREQEILGDRLARRAACYRLCCAPTRLDRLASRLGRTNDCLEGAR